MSPAKIKKQAIVVFPQLRGRIKGLLKQENIEEMDSLLEAAGMKMLHWEIQRISKFCSKTLIGIGKAQSLREAGRDLRATVLVVAHPLTGNQVRNLEEVTELEVMDRSEVILDIFAKRARTGEGKVQVELARLRFMLPRLIGRGRQMSRLGGGLGTRGPGEMKVEVDRRRIRAWIGLREQKLKAIRKHRGVQRARRQRYGVARLALVGYTNSGKTTLLNSLTGAESFADPLPFATLDPLTRKLYLGPKQNCLLTDTVGFIRDLPPDLSAAFRATMEEVQGTEGLIHVVDASSRDRLDKIEIVSTFLSEILTQDTPSILVFSKIDLLPLDRQNILKRMHPQAILFSAKTGVYTTGLKQAIGRLLDSQKAGAAPG